MGRSGEREPVSWWTRTPAKAGSTSPTSSSSDILPSSTSIMIATLVTGLVIE